MPVLRWSGATARYSCLRVPVETGTPPYRRSKVRSVQDALTGIPHNAPLLLLSKPDPLALGSGLVTAAAPQKAKSALFGTP